MLTDELESWIIVKFLSDVWTLILTAPIHWNKLIYIGDDLRVSTFSANFHSVCVCVCVCVCVDYTFKSTNT